MAAGVHVECVRKAPDQEPPRRVEGIGGQNPDGTRWKMSEDHAISAIEKGEQNFVIVLKGRSVRVMVAIHDGRKYLKTVADGSQANSLLSLPECSDG